ncbi:MAG: 1-(5-phosphoribosyl)-5-[(5-phosphoribosylamino)methylideneamino]imidazole-4-carboxamide isomerase [Anaerolineae bacterium]|nr:1-(5-phosphoribosyl)-5-[(5-phosphoribosylamino)methylideneamino]imidazole-4-carboxamide isomerase [Anaerolineae bacterium]
MIIFPAVDLRQGKCVRLTQGRPDAQTVYSDDPVVMSLRWEVAGASWLHVVNLDGAFAGALRAGAEPGDLPINVQVLRDMVNAATVPVQFGGGVRSLDDIQFLLDLGVQRVILGTAAIRIPDLVSAALVRFGAERIVVGVDARDGRVATLGWQETSDVDAVDLGREMHRRGVRRIIYTDIARDGMLTGVNVASTAQLARATGLRVIAAGGVASLDDIRALKAAEADGIEGVVVGKALYTGAVNLAQAIQICQFDPG